ncbi:GTP cyclohydrolase II [Ascobolus immersus RN42]|uniref:GTP cyclohydrolase II n=1 Tax=Ascobolus immersus RN42 TaxID=1160509 RepID=A0A3N4IB98_ASCIM|nr:GTP cyclohydrolase II [Ascobolus immersus RN42]
MDQQSNASAPPPPLHEPKPRLHLSHSHLALAAPRLNELQREDNDEAVKIPPALVSPAFTPPTTMPGTPDLAGVRIGKDERELGVGMQLEEKEPIVRCIVRARIPTTTGTEVYLHLYENNVDTKEHLAIVFGDTIRSTSLDAPRPGETEMDRMVRGAYTGKLYPGRTSSRLPTDPPIDNTPLSEEAVREKQDRDDAEMSNTEVLQLPLVRIHSECYTGEVSWSARCDCGEQLDEAARLMSLPSLSSRSGAGSGIATPRTPGAPQPHNPGGVIVYLRQEGRGIGLGEKLKAYNLQDLGNDTVEANLLLRHPADGRSYGVARAILRDLKCTRVRLLTNNPDKVRALEGGGVKGESAVPQGEERIRVVRRVGMVPKMWRGEEGGVRGEEVGKYLRTKITKMGHLLAEDQGDRSLDVLTNN